MDALVCIRRVILLSLGDVRCRNIPSFPDQASPIPVCLAWLVFLAAMTAPFPVAAQEACLKSCAYPDYPGMTFTLGDGFTAQGGEVKVTHLGFLGRVYNNDGITPRKVGVPNYIGELSFINPITGEDKFLFRNQKDWVTHENDSGTVISLGSFPKGAPIVFKYVNVDGKEKSFKTFDRFSGDNAAGSYDFNADPVLKNLFINGKPKPVSGGSWNWEGHDYNKWCVAASVPGTDVKQFQFEDADDRIFNDIVFRVSGVALVSETYQLLPPVISGAPNPDGSYRVSIENAADSLNKGSRIFYTTDGSAPAVDSTGVPQGSTLDYTASIPLSATATIKARAWKKAMVDGNGNTTRYLHSPVVSQTFTVVKLQWSGPTATPPGGNFQGSVSVTLDQAEGAAIHYRLCDPGAVCDAPSAADPVYTVPIVVMGSKILKAIAIQAPRENSDVAVFTFLPSYVVADAVYLDRNGDGRIDAAAITLNGLPAALPVSLSLEDPFNPGKPKSIAATALHWDGAKPGLLWAEFPDSPFKAGTGFIAGPYGTFTQGGEGYPAAAFNVRDGAGPVILSADADVSLDTLGIHKLTVVLTEKLGDSSGTFPYAVKRATESLEGQLQVSKSEQIGDRTYQYTFSSKVFPVPGDSLKATVSALDDYGNPSAMPAFIEIQGKRIVVAAHIRVAGGGCVHGNVLSHPEPLAIPISVILPHGAEEAGSCIETRETPDCLDCLAHDWKRTDPKRPEAAAIPAGPEIRVTTRWPFTFDLAYFNTLGEFVNHAKGEVSAKMLDAVAPDTKGEKTVALRWYPVSESGMQAGTGAYVVKGSVSTKAGVDKESVPGVPVEVPPATQKVLVRFGYLRQ